MKYLKITLSLLLLIISYNAMADFLLTKNDNKTVHTVNIITPHNKAALIAVKASFGKLVGGSCQYTKLINIGELIVEEQGDNNSKTMYGITNDKLKGYVGDGYTCGKFNFSFNQTKEDEFELVWDGKDYVDSRPSTSSIAVE